MKSILLNVDEELKRKIRMEAASKDMSMNGFIVWLVGKYLEREKKPLQNETKKPSKPKVQEETPVVKSKVEEEEEEDRGSYGSGRVKLDDEWFKKGTDDKWVGEEKGEVYTDKKMKSMLGKEE